MGTGRGEQRQFPDVALGIVCPMANEASSADAFVRLVVETCTASGFESVRFFAVLDRVSTDGTRELLHQLAANRPELEVVWAPENRSVVDAYLRGYREAIDAGCDWILEIDAGFSHDPADIPAFFEAMADGQDCVFGSRFGAGGSITDSSWKRTLLSRGGSTLANALLGTGLEDVTSGFELFRADVLRDVLATGVRSRGPFFQTEIKARCHKLRVVEVPIRYRGASHTVGRAAIQDSFVNLGRLFVERLRGRL
ncbi:MAG: dolichol-phosphate mannosyltransferase [Acidimicrobiales bacterium]|nr:dolichol-phosphate mannosyltransferase [Acidimicrobiales bacterium]